LDDFEMLSRKLVEIACDMKIKGETDFGKTRSVNLSHYEICLLDDALHLVAAVRAIAPKGRQ
jgi:hypothetical protein